ncbi:hypothetical protein CDCA_CDCA04G1183 [Cyanidium caldarium]|uniref:Uncharacterized protein n=1 Tax=Cyanidium caldarium TaxID=2771 RepID=A0AAV9ITG9_CYACA|nr:hypothetical protein CDCA_CDCA04G1183 [Cyanidium caldarium]|eukprot:ctg_126.g79
MEENSGAPEENRAAADAPDWPSMPREEAFFGFHPALLTEDLISAVDDYVWDALEGLEASLEREGGLAATASALDKENGAAGGAPVSLLPEREALQLGLERLRKQLREAADWNMDQLELYVLRNVLRIPSDLRGWELGTMKIEHGDDDLPRWLREAAASPDGTLSEAEEAAVDAQLAVHRDRLREIRAEQKRLRRERALLRSDRRALAECQSAVSHLVHASDSHDEAAGERLEERLRHILHNTAQLQRLVAENREHFQRSLDVEPDTECDDARRGSRRRSLLGGAWGEPVATAPLHVLERHFQQHRESVSLDTPQAAVELERALRPS